MLKLFSGFLAALLCAVLPLSAMQSIFPDYAEPVIVRGNMSLEQACEVADYRVDFELQLSARPNKAGDKDVVALKFNQLELECDRYDAPHVPHLLLPYWIYERRVRKDKLETVRYQLPLSEDELFAAGDVISELQELFDWEWEAKIDYAGRRFRIDDPCEGLWIEEQASYLIAEQIARRVPEFLFTFVSDDLGSVDLGLSQEEICILGPDIYLERTHGVEQLLLRWNLQDPCDFAGNLTWSSKDGTRMRCCFSSQRTDASLAGFGRTE